MPAIDEDDKPKKKGRHMARTLLLEELGARVELLRDEISRLQGQ